MQKRALIVSLIAALMVGAVAVTGIANPAIAQEPAVELAVLGTVQLGDFAEGAAEISAYDPTTQQVFTVNAQNGTVDVIDISDPATPTVVSSLELPGDPTHVTVCVNTVAVSVEGEENTDPGQVVFFDIASGEQISAVTVGALPDMVVFTPDCTKVVTANEGEPSDDYGIDPEGSISIINVADGFASLTDANVTTVGFADFNTDGPRAAELDENIRIYGPNATVAQDLEPEYLAVSPDSSTAYVTLQENNALAIIDINAGSVTSLVWLGLKDHNVEGNGLDASHEDGEINIANYPIFGMYQPDAIAVFEVDGTLYLATANEGDTREYDEEGTFTEEMEIGDLDLDPTAFPNAAELQAEDAAGVLNITSVTGDDDGDGDFDRILTYGARSFTLWSAADGALVWDSGDDFEQITAEMFPEDFNADNEENDTFDDRSDNKGPEPESVVVGEVNGRYYAFVGLERIGGVMVYDVTDPTMPSFVQYLNNRDFAGDPVDSTAGDLGPEGLLFITADNSPTGAPLLVGSNEVSSTVTIYSVTR